MTAHRETPLQPRIVEPFGGPGGWAEGLRLLGRTDAIGIEWCADACATAQAAGHARVNADVAALDPIDFASEHCGGSPEGLIASPPCQAWSAAGKRGAEHDRPLVAHVLEQLAAGRDVRAAACADAVDPRSILVVEPLRWALALRPQWIACEQVEPALEAWRWTAQHLEAVGYSTWCGVLSAERYGVPQTRRRAILIASLDGRVTPPAPTHQRYRAGEPAREEHTMDGVLAPWISMGAALGWGFDDQPSPTVTGGGTGSGGGVEVFGNAATRRRLAMVSNAQKNAATRGVDEPAATRGVDEPAATIKSGHDYNDRRWILDTNRDQRPDGSRQQRPAHAPAPALTGKSGGQWYWTRPATTVAGDPRIAAPGHRDRAGGERQHADSIPVTLEEALVLQGFAADYPVAGSSKAKRFEQVGNAVPPPLAAAVLRAAMAPTLEATHAA